MLGRFGMLRTTDGVYRRLLGDFILDSRSILLDVEILCKTEGKRPLLTRTATEALSSLSPLHPRPIPSATLTFRTSGLEIIGAP